MYQIATAEELREFAKLVNGGKTTANAILTADIDLNPGFTFKEDGSYSGPDEEEPHQWTPIGNSINQYIGTFDGNGHTISGLYIDSNADGQGLFGYVSGSGTVQNLSVSGSVSVSGNRYVGGVVGLNLGTVINCAFSGSVSGSDHVGGVVGYNGDIGSVKNCYNIGKVTGSAASSNVGGVVGYNDEGPAGRVENCYNTGEVSGGEEVGGVVGDNRGSVKNSYNTGKVSGPDSVGGVVGNNYNGSVENCYNTGAVSGVEGVGGVVGQNFGGTVENCYNTGTVTGTGTDDYVGGVVGWNVSGGTVTGCYFLQTTGVNESLQGIGRDDSATGATAAAVKDLSELCEKFENDPWSISPFCEHPVLKTNPEGGDGTKEHPYEIKTIDQLKTFRDIVNDANGQVKDSDAHAKLMNDIDLEGSATNQWTPIGNSEENAYTGTFNGNGNTISGLTINDSNADDQGLFGYVGTGGTVKDLTVSGSVSGRMFVGGIAGRNGGNVINCAFSGSVSGNSPVGGVVGSNSFSATVTNCYNTGTVTGTSKWVGGVVGLNSGGNVENCYNIGDVSGGEDVGGVVGYNSSIVVDNNSGTVKNCYNTGTVSDGTTSGGVVGQNFGSGSVTNCYFLPTADVNKNLSGIGLGGEGQEAIQKTADEFRSGEVAYLLQGTQTTPVWGQSALGTEDSLPTLVALDKDENAKPVYKVVFISDNTEIEAQYANNGMTVGSPTTNPTKEGYTFAGWFTKSSGGSQWNFNDPVNKSMNLYAQWTAVEEPDPEPTPEPEPEEPPYTGKYSYELSTSVGDHGSLTVDRYATEGDKVTIDVTPDQAYKLDALSVTANGKDVELTAGGDGTYTFTMPSADVKITATFAEDPDWTEPEEPTTDVSDLFIDIAPDAWYKDAVQYAYDQGLMTGVSATEFDPEATTTRAMIVSILARLEGVTTAQAAGFADVNDEWYATAVNWAANVGVVNGYEDNTFRPNTAITREQLAAILMNYAAYKGEDVSNRADLTSYTDQPSTWATETMSWAVAEGLITGVTNTELQPQGNATRAQVAAILQRYLEA